MCDCCALPTKILNLKAIPSNTQARSCHITAVRCPTKILNLKAIPSYRFGFEVISKGGRVWEEPYFAQGPFPEKNKGWSARKQDNTPPYSHRQPALSATKINKVYESARAQETNHKRFRRLCVATTLLNLKAIPCEKRETTKIIICSKIMRQKSFQQRRRVWNDSK